MGRCLLAHAGPGAGRRTLQLLSLWVFAALLVNNVVTPAALYLLLRNARDSESASLLMVNSSDSCSCPVIQASVTMAAAASWQWICLQPTGCIVSIVSHSRRPAHVSQIPSLHHPPWFDRQQRGSQCLLWIPYEIFVCCRMCTRRARAAGTFRLPSGTFPLPSRQR